MGMGARVISFRNLPDEVIVLEQNSTLSDFNALCSLFKGTSSAEFYVYPDSQKIDLEAETRELPFYTSCRAIDKDKRVWIEKPPKFLGELTFSLSDVELKNPLGFTKIKHIDDLIRYARRSAIYVAQNTLDCVSFFKPHYLMGFNKIADISRIDAKNRERIPCEPMIIYLDDER